MKTLEGEIRYTGHNPKTGENTFVAPSGFTDMPPVPFAKLISQAPAMLEALERILNEVDGEYSKHPASVASVRFIRDHARATIQKATS